MVCLRKGLISNADTAWRLLNKEIIGGARKGISTGPRNYSVVDYNVHNDVVYEYRLESVDYNNAREPFGKYAEVRPGRIIPHVFDLRANYPNPFRSVTMIRYAIPVKTQVDLYVFNLQGRLVRRLVDGARLAPGSYKAQWDGKDDFGRAVASGPYVYRLQSPLFVKARVMILSR
jgi:5-hydroxyisourate hydrolase-like protein (transthyretin family)